ncbi:hypothetical protein M8J75_012668 [Diaphorina citri]|nr:hypothetical protein M8J75_012668 [Diaphorina citri]
MALVSIQRSPNSLENNGTSSELDALTRTGIEPDTLRGQAIKRYENALRSVTSTHSSTISMDVYAGLFPFLLPVK